MRKLTMEELGRLNPDAFASSKKIPVSIVLDGIRSALNVGSIFRTADAFALEKIYLCGITATPPHREILKTALGSTETVAWEYCTTSTEALQKLKAIGYKIWAVEQAEGSIQLQNLDFQGRESLALVFGNEVEGVSEAVLQACDGCIEIPQFGTKHSLNVAVCTGILAWEASKCYNFK
jgi:tRNA G18 (ribose-2'-O)-methylase SpoU